MTVKELKEILSDYPDDLEVIKKYDDLEHGAHDFEDIAEVYRDRNDLLILD
ncbi:MAG: hypothetical protein K1W14_06520 [Muribaculaceae bacterium]